MEDNPPTQDSGPSDGREAPRPRTQRAAFGAPEPAAPKARPADRDKPRPDAAKAAPAVMFQPPPGESDPDAATPQPGRARTPRKQKPKSSSGTPTPSPPKAATPGQRRAAGPAAARRTANASPEPAAPESAAAPHPDAPERATAPEPHSPERAAAPTPTNPERTTAPQQTSEPVPSVTSPHSGAHRVTPDRPAKSGTASTGVESSATQPQPESPATPAKAAPPAKAAAPAKAATPAKAAAPAKAAGKKAAPRKAGLAARTEITPAKAFPDPATPAQGAGRTPLTPPPAKKAARKAARPSAVPAEQTSIDLTPGPDVTSAPAEEAAPAPAQPAKPESQETTADATAPKPAPVVGIIPTQPSRTEAVEARADAPLPDRVLVRPESADLAEAGETRVEVPAELISAVEATRTAARVAVPTAWSRIAADPGHTPELLALAAVQLIGPRAAEWARESRESYPSADRTAIARLAVQQFSRRAGIANAFASVAGSYAPIALLGTTGWTHAELVLHVAAAFGQDPTDLARAADLLVLTRVHPTHEEARAAIGATMEPAAQGEAGPGDAVWRLGRMAANQAAGWLALRAVSRFFPGTTLLVTALMSRSGAENLGVRATAYYRAAAQRESEPGRP